MIKRIELINFMSHQHTVIEPSSGLTVLIGPNNCGKSAVVTALQILCNNPKSTYVLRHGAKECKIIVETDSGDVIQWSRKKSGSPKYLINGELFDRLKSKVPEPLHQILRMPKVQVDKESFDVHFGEQTSPLFLLGDKEKAAAQFFASSSDAIRLVEMQDRHKSNIKFRKADLKRVSKERESLHAENLVLSPVTALYKLAQACEKNRIKIADEQSLMVRIGVCVESIQSAQQRALLLDKQNDALRAIPDPPALRPIASISAVIDSIGSAENLIQNTDFQLKAMADLQTPPKLQPTKRLKQWVAVWEQNQQAKAIAEGRLHALSGLSNPPQIASTKVLEQTIGRLVTGQRKRESLDRDLKTLGQLSPVPELTSTSALSQLIARHDELSNQLTDQQNRLRSNDQQIATTEEALAQWLDRNPQCPTCGGPVTKEQLMEKNGGHVHA